MGHIVPFHGAIPTQEDDLTEVKRRLIDSVAQGIGLDLAGDEQIDEADLDMLYRLGMVDAPLRAFLRASVLAGAKIFVAGGTGMGNLASC